MNRKEQILILRNLIELHNDRIEVYETASNKTREEVLKNLFWDFVETSKRCKQELLTEVKQLGGTANGMGQTSGAFFSAWMDVTAFITGSHPIAVINSSEAADKMTLDVYYNTLRNNLKNISARQQHMLNAQYALLMANNNQLKELRNPIKTFSYLKFTITEIPLCVNLHHKKSKQN